MNSLPQASNLQNGERFNGIDAFKLIAAFFIVIIHTDYGSSIGNSEYLHVTTRWAVPFFFMVAGFFLSRKQQQPILDIKLIAGSLKKLTSIFIVASIIYAPVYIAQKGLSLPITILLTGTYMHLWFIPSLIVGYLGTWYISQFNSAKFSCCISLGILFAFLITSSYDTFLGRNISIAIPRFLSSIAFMHIGAIVQSHLSILKKYQRTMLTCALLGYIAQFLEYHFVLRGIHNEYELLLGTIICVPAIFALSASIEMREGVLARWGSRHSLFIYVMHPMLILYLVPSLRKIGLGDSSPVRLATPVIIFGICLATAILLHRLFPKLYMILNGEIALKSSRV